MRRAKTKKQPGRRRRRDDFDEDTDAEEERVDKYGAWIECGVWCVSSLSGRVDPSRGGADAGSVGQFAAASRTTLDACRSLRSAS